MTSSSKNRRHYLCAISQASYTRARLPSCLPPMEYFKFKTTNDANGLAQSPHSHELACLILRLDKRSARKSKNKTTLKLRGPSYSSSCKGQCTPCDPVPLGIHTMINSIQHNSSPAWSLLFEESNIDVQEKNAKTLTTTTQFADLGLSVYILKPDN